MTDYNTRKWNKKMTIEEMLPLMSDAELRKNARRGGIAAIAELERREAPQPTPTAAVMSQLFRQPTTLVTRADILAERRHGSYIGV